MFGFTRISGMSWRSAADLMLRGVVLLFCPCATTYPRGFKVRRVTRPPLKIYPRAACREVRRVHQQAVA